MEVVEEEVFFKWKEEVNDEYPGKGKALFQVIFFARIWMGQEEYVKRCIFAIAQQRYFFSCSD